MVVQVEDQKQLNDNGRDTKNLMSMNVNRQPPTPPAQTRGQKPQYQKQYVEPFKKMISKEEKRKQKCAHCQEMGHEMDECIKLHGVPDLYKKLKESRGQYRANCVNSTPEGEVSNGNGTQKEGNQNMSKMIQSELIKCMEQFFQQQSAGGNNNKSDDNLVHESGKKPHHFNGHYAFSVLPSMLETEWVIDSGASSHICPNPELLYTTYQMDKLTMIYLPDGSS